MWRRLKNILHSLSTYAELSPDVRVKQRVRQNLRLRPAWSKEEWFEQYWRRQAISRQLSDFVYIQMQDYSGLEFARVRPDDRLVEDLQLPLVCWFDWQLSLCDDFWQVFGVELHEQLDLENLATVEDLVLFLNQQLVSVNHS